MVQNAIKIYGRLKPCSKKMETADYHIYHSPESSNDMFILKRQQSDHQNKNDRLTFRFHKVFDQSARQEDVFNIVAKPVVESVLSGYNGTVFAYGQTGSGKTFTITGGVGKYDDRGIIPRTIQHLFKTLYKGLQCLSTLFVTYLEIYNEHGYDLLDPKHDVSKIEDLPNVAVLEDANGELHLRNLSVHPVSTEEEALNLLFLGDTNRMVTETPMNPHSSRSHCIFTIHLTSRNPETSTVRHSKLNLVDLAGSERVYKSQLAGQLLSDARHINLSLHFLEQVILALAEVNRSHIPYRNSMMTTILRDSLGGNCLTVMIATLCLSIRNLDESLSTCRFAQRVALVKNEVNLNEELDPEQEISMLRTEVQELRSQLERNNKEEDSGVLTSSDVNECKELVKHYLESGPEAEFVQLHSPKKVQLCFSLLKNSVLEARQELVKCQASERKEQVHKYLDQLKQRDKEISILIRLLKNEQRTSLQSKIDKNALKSLLETPDAIEADLSDVSRTSSSSDFPEIAKLDGHSNEVKLDAFKQFLSDPDNRGEIKDCQAMLTRKYDEARKVAEDIKQSQEALNDLHAVLKQNTKDPSAMTTQNANIVIEVQNKIQIEQAYYKDKIQQLHVLKMETEYLKHAYQQIKKCLLVKFQEWWKIQENNHLPESRSGSAEIRKKSSTGKSTYNRNNVVDVTNIYSNESGCLEKSCETVQLQNRLAGNELKDEDTINYFPRHYSNSTVPVHENYIYNDCNISGTNRLNYESCDPGSTLGETSSGHCTDYSGINSKISQNIIYNENESENFAAENNPSSNPTLEVPVTITNDIQEESLIEGIPLTGDPEIDEEIIAFYKARSKIICR